MRLNYFPSTDADNPATIPSETAAFALLAPPNSALPAHRLWLAYVGKCGLLRLSVCADVCLHTCANFPLPPPGACPQAAENLVVNLLPLPLLPTRHACPYSFAASNVHMPQGHGCCTLQRTPAFEQQAHQCAVHAQRLKLRAAHSENALNAAVPISSPINPAHCKQCPFPLLPIPRNRSMKKDVGCSLTSSSYARPPSAHILICWRRTPWDPLVPPRGIR